MKILGQYVLREWFFAFSVAILANIGLLVIEDLYKNAADFVQSGMPVERFVCYYFWLLIRVLPVVIPVSFFLSLLFSLGKLHKQNEILAMRMTGANIFQITGPLWVASIILSTLGIWLNVSISSRAYKNTQNFRISPICRDIAFDNLRDHRTWFITSFDKKNRTGLNAMVLFYNDSGEEIKRLFAKHITYKNKQWIFQNVTETLSDPVTKRSVHVNKFDTMQFDFSETPGLFFSLKKRVKYLSIPELRKILSYSNDTRSYIDYRVQYYRSIISPLSCILILFITVPFVTTGVRRNPMSGVAKASGGLGLFYIISNIFSTFGSHGVIPLSVVLLAPYLVVLAFSYLLYRKCV